MRTNLAHYLLPITYYLLPIILATPSVAQSPLSACILPENNEYLLLIVTETEEERAKVIQAIPNDIEVSFCNYLGQNVTHIGSFSSREDTDEWGQYFQQNLGLMAIIIESTPTPPSEVVSQPPQTIRQEPEQSPSRTLPSLSPSSEAIPESSPVINQEPPQAKEPVIQTISQTNNNLSYNPQPLGTGYAILIDYVNQPEIADQLQQLLNKEIGLASYLARPYLMAIHTTSEREANAMLKNLSDRGFWTIMVDSSKVTLLTPIVK
ncbi:MAG: hypothetical protein WA865_07825 [Spirulinaceae cyanobacterium]